MARWATISSGVAKIAEDQLGGVARGELEHDEREQADADQDGDGKERAPQDEEQHVP